MPARRTALARAAAGVLTVAGCGSGPRHAAAAPKWRGPAPHPSGPPAPTSPSPVSHVLTSGDGPDGSVSGTGSAAVALTFDDGPDPGNTPKLLDLLGQNGVKATF